MGERGRIMKKFLVLIALCIFLNINIESILASDNDEEIDLMKVPWEYDDIYDRLEERNSIFNIFSESCDYEQGLLYEMVKGQEPPAGFGWPQYYMIDCDLKSRGLVIESTVFDLGETHVVNKIFGAAGEMTGAYGQWYVELMTEKDEVILRTTTLSARAGKIELFENPVKGVRKIKIIRKRGEPQQARVAAIEIYGSPESEIPDSFDYPVKNVKANIDGRDITLTWTNPDSDWFNHVNIYKEGELITRVDAPNNSITLLEEHLIGYSYEYELRAVDAFHNESEGVFITVEIPIPQTEVIDLKAEPQFNRVNLSWKNPSYNDFHHVIIYRKDNVNIRNAFDNFLFGTVYADDEFKAIFETNGTYFNDLTVKPERTYQYKLTTESIDGVESDGVTITVTTPPEPPPKMGGVEQEQDENGDYVFKWTSPTEGTVKILVGGEEYATVPASDRQITIPKDDMKYTPLGNPDVRLVPISESGKEGSPTYPGTVGGGGSIKIPFTPKDVLTSAVQLFGVVGPFLLLILAIYVTRVYLIPLIRKSASKREVREGRRFRT